MARSSCTCLHIERPLLSIAAYNIALRPPREKVVALLDACSIKVIYIYGSKLQCRQHFTEAKSFRTLRLLSWPPREQAAARLTNAPELWSPWKVMPKWRCWTGFQRMSSTSAAGATFSVTRSVVANCRTGKAPRSALCHRHYHLLHDARPVRPRSSLLVKRSGVTTTGFARTAIMICKLVPELVLDSSG